MRGLRAFLPMLLVSTFSGVLADFDNASLLPNLPAAPTLQASTVPGNGDNNPYGVAFVPHGFARGPLLRAGDILVSNFNGSSGFQGTGTTIVRVRRDGSTALFFQGPSGLGLTTALGTLRRGYVLVGNVPTTDGSFATIGQGSLLVLDRFGNQVASLSDATFLDGPWDLTIRDMGARAQVFVSNVLSGTVTRLDLTVNSTVTVKHMTQIASGYLHMGDPAALAIGPTGLAYDRESGRLFVASTGDNAIFSIANAGRRTTDAGMGDLVYSDSAHLRGPLGLVLAPNGDLITTNGDAINGDPSDPSAMVEFTQSGEFVAEMVVNSTAQGGAFGIALAGDDEHVVLAAVDDILQALDVWVVNLEDD